MKKLLAVLFLFVVSGCAIHDNLHKELSYNWEQKQAFYQNASRAHLGTYYSGVPEGLQGWDLQAHMTTKSEELASAVLVASLSYERVNQWRQITKMRLEVIDCIEMLDNHPPQHSPEDERKFSKFRRYMESLLGASDEAMKALQYCER